ncbi:helix-turn-helix domain-containing protein [Acinetobacter guillouiae]|uniref:helix-turn-helix domain-containing protein n=1 Tax=Acinetobacter guillouiae TaxID=106649 RepID=UPI003AF52D9B
MKPQTLNENDWTFSTHNFEITEQKNVWQNAMEKVFLSVPTYHSDNLSGEINYKKTPLGLEFVMLSGSPQTIIGNYPDITESLWLAIILEGEAELKINHEVLDLRNKNILYGSSGNIDYVELNMYSEFKILTIEIPNTVFYKRLINPLSIRAGVLEPNSGMSALLSEFLQSISKHIQHLKIDKFHAIETSLTELFLSNLSDKITIQSFTNKIHAESFKHVCHLIEENIHNPALNLTFLAQKNHVSTRYIQKLFNEANLSINQYIRERRLELCKRDLSNHMNQHLSISEICYRWGFNDLAYFSRVFSQYVGICPSDYRNKAIQKI